MTRLFRLIPFAFRLSVVLLCVARLAAGGPAINATANGAGETGTSGTENSSTSANLISWNVNEKELPLLNLKGELKADFAQSLAYRLDQFNLPILQTLIYDEEDGRYLLPAFKAPSTTNHFIEFAVTDVKNAYVSTDGLKLSLIDNDGMKTISTSDGAKYVFVRYPDNEFHCAVIKDTTGTSINLLYTANGLVLHGMVDAAGRTVTFSYAAGGISSVTQTWMANSQGLTKTWPVGDPTRIPDAQTNYSHANALKLLPTTAVVRAITSELAASDKLLARIFGGPNAVAAANSFEPDGLASFYPRYRGDTVGDDGVERRGHLSYAMHLYGSADGTGDSPLYVPAGFTTHSAQPSPTDAVVTFYYPNLGNLLDVTLAVFHVADFQISNEGARVLIGRIGGPGGASPLYKHSHIEFYRGNSGLPSLSSRAGLRIDPAKVFSPRKAE
jgi:hypothetical protein